MAVDNFDRAMTLVFVSEGGFVHDPRDPGGATNLGVTKKTLEHERGQSVTVADVRALGRPEASGIYRKSYWNTVHGDELPAGLDYATFDYAVNSGPARAIMSLQKALGVAPDGRIGQLTMAAAATCDAKIVVRALTRERLAFLRALSTWPAFGRGWTRRVEGVETSAIAMASAVGIGVTSSAAWKPTGPKSAAIPAPAVPSPKPPGFWARLGAGLNAIASRPS